MAAVHPTAPLANWASLWSLPTHPVPCPVCEYAHVRDAHIVVGSLVASTWRPGLLRCDSCGRHFDWVLGRAHVAPPEPGR